MQLPKELGIDVCGVYVPYCPRGAEIPKEYFITHTDADQIPGFLPEEKALFKCADFVAKKLVKIYGARVEYEILPKDECIPTYHVHSGLMGQPYVTDSCGYLHKDMAIIPESKDVLSLVKEYSPKCLALVMFHQPLAHLQEQRITLDELHNYCDHAWFADPRIWFSHDSKVLPKRVYSMKDVLMKPENHASSPFYRRFR